MTKLEFTCSDEKSVFLLKAARLYDEGVKLEPVRHGELRSTGFDEIYCEWGDCSECGADNRINAKFCNNCGARLDRRDGAR